MNGAKNSVVVDGELIRTSLYDAGQFIALAVPVRPGQLCNVPTPNKRTELEVMDAETLLCYCSLLQSQVLVDGDNRTVVRSAEALMITS